jgi:hypothetical protein
MDLSSSAFKGCLNTTFQVVEPPVGLELVQHEPGKPSTAVEQFSLLFHGPDQPLLGQGSYQFEHARMGAFEMFIVPIGREPGRLIYEAVFSRLLHQSAVLASEGRA